MKIKFCLCSLLIIAALSITGCSDIKRKEDITPVRQYFVNIATGHADSQDYLVGATIAEMLSKEIPGVNASAQTTGDQFVSVDLLSKNKAQIAFLRGDIAFYAQNGLEMFKDHKAANLKNLISLYSQTIQIVTLDRTRVKGIEDIKGRRLAIVGVKGGYEEIAAKQLLKAYGINFEDIIVQNVNISEAAQNLLQGGTDAIFVIADCPDDDLQELSRKEQTVFLPLDYQKLAMVIYENPFYVKSNIPTSTYARQINNVQTLSLLTMLVANDKIDEDMGYKIAKTIYNNYGKFNNQRISAHLKNRKQAGEDSGLPINEGAKRFFTE